MSMTIASIAARLKAASKNSNAKEMKADAHDLIEETIKRDVEHFYQAVASAWIESMIWQLTKLRWNNKKDVEEVCAEFVNRFVVLDVDLETLEQGLEWSGSELRIKGTEQVVAEVSPLGLMRFRKLYEGDGHIMLKPMNIKPFQGGLALARRLTVRAYFHRLDELKAHTKEVATGIIAELEKGNSLNKAQMCEMFRTSFDVVNDALDIVIDTGRVDINPTDSGASAYSFKDAVKPEKKAAKPIANGIKKAVAVMATKAALTAPGLATASTLWADWAGDSVAHISLNEDGEKGLYFENHNANCKGNGYQSQTKLVISGAAIKMNQYCWDGVSQYTAASKKGQIYITNRFIRDKWVNVHGLTFDATGFAKAWKE